MTENEENLYLIRLMGEGMFAYLKSFTSELTDIKTTEGQDIVLAAIADAIYRYEKFAGFPIKNTLALNLLDANE